MLVASPCYMGGGAHSRPASDMLMHAAFHCLSPHHCVPSHLAWQVPAFTLPFNITTLTFLLFLRLHPTSDSGLQLQSFLTPSSHPNPVTPSNE